VSVLRYEPTVDSTASGPSARMLVRTEGEWVKYAEYLAIEARVATLEAAAAMLREDFESECG